MNSGGDASHAYGSGEDLRGKKGLLHFSDSIGLEIQPSILLSNSSIVPHATPPHSVVAGVALWRHFGTLEIIAVPQLHLVTHYGVEWRIHPGCN